MTKKRVLFISQEINPFLPKSEISSTVRQLSQGIQESGREIRNFMPRFGVINERRHQLHEVIRLSGINLIINDQDHPLIIKVASVPAAKMQVYFIDNEEFFKRKGTTEDKEGSFYPDNDERSIFFVRGVVETIKKLGWIPDVIHCHGWMTALLPLYLKNYYKDDPHFDQSKIVYSIYNDGFEGSYSDSLVEKLKFDGIEDSEIASLKEATAENLHKIATKYSDALIQGTEELSASNQSIFDGAEIEKLAFTGEDEMVEAYNALYSKVMEEETLLVD